MDWKNHLEKNPIQKIEKTVKIEVKSPHVNKKKTGSEKANFCSNTVFSLYFKIRANQFHAAKPLAFSLHFQFQRDQNHDSNYLPNIMKMCVNRSFKDSASIHFKFFHHFTSQKKRRCPQ